MHVEKAGSMQEHMHNMEYVEMSGKCYNWRKYGFMLEESTQGYNFCFEGTDVLIDLANP